MDYLPQVTCICATYKRPKLLQNALACFLAQDYPNKRLIMLEDSGQRHCQSVNLSPTSSWQLVSTNIRCKSLSNKHELLAKTEGVDWEVLLVWDDDDIYLPWHISSCVKALPKVELGPPPKMAHLPALFIKPSTILSTYGRRLHPEDAAGRFHGSIGMTRTASIELRRLYDCVWPDTKRSDFDQQIIGRLSKFPTVNPCRFASPSYIYRWESSETHHHSSFGGEVDYEGQDERYSRALGNIICPDELTPEFDQETAKLYAELKP